MYVCGSGLHKLSNSPLLPLVFALGYVTMRAILYFFNKGCLVDAMTTVLFLPWKEPEEKQPAATIAHTVGPQARERTGN